MRRGSLTQSIGVLVAVSIVAGIIMAGMLLPFVGGGGLLARTATTDFAKLPTDLKRKPLPQISRVLAANGEPIATFYDQDRVIVPLTQIPAVMQTALIDIEDVRFYEHAGIDFKGTLRALLHNGQAGSVTQGGSTLTQQYVKNVLIEDARTKKQREAAIADTFARKLKEARYAIELEKTLTKPEILDDYLNIAYFGDGAYGIGAAAEHFFHEKVSDLTLDQSALLAGLVQSPEAYDPRYYPKVATERRNTVLGQMLKYHSITQATYNRAVAQPIKLHIHNQPADCIASKFAYFCDYVKHVFEHTPGLSLTMLRRGGLTVTTTLSPKVQEAAQHGIHAYVHAHERKSHVVSAEAVVQPGTGQVKALAVSTPYGNSKKKGQNSIDYAVDERYGGSPGFHAGSTFKLFVLTAALKEGIPLSTKIKSPGTVDITGLTNCAGLPVAPWPVHNASDSESGTFNLESGTWFSVNTFFAQLEERTGVCEPVKLAEAMGVTQGTGKPPEQIGPFVLGAGAQYGFSPLDVAGAYATMAAHGKYCTPIVITSIVDRTGHHYPVPKSRCTQVVPQGLANTVTSILRGVLTVPGATGTTDALTGRPAAAKTGTVDNYDGSWFAGYTPQLASAVWAGIPAEPNRTLDGLNIGGVTYGEVFGATIAGKIWQATLNAALKGDPVLQFTGPSSYYEIGIQQKVPDVVGDSPASAEATLSKIGFTPQIVPGSVHSSEPAGTVARTAPPGGSQAPIGSVIKLFISDGTPKPSKSASPPPSSPPPSSSPPTPPPSSPPVSPSGSPTKHPHRHHRHHRH
ncbi:MAG TPA: transglycosylase domain-containing protein [Mycobacteriales bacterium]|nr:transglycosylase domain-containing protein [Mycobacteriales bacterium]